MGNGNFVFVIGVDKKLKPLIFFLSAHRFVPRVTHFIVLLLHLVTSLSHLSPLPGAGGVLHFLMTTAG